MGSALSRTFRRKSGTDDGRRKGKKPSRTASLPRSRTSEESAEQRNSKYATLPGTHASTSRSAPPRPEKPAISKNETAQPGPTPRVIPAVCDVPKPEEPVVAQTTLMHYTTPDAKQNEKWEKVSLEHPQDNVPDHGEITTETVTMSEMADVALMPPTFTNEHVEKVIAEEVSSEMPASAKVEQIDVIPTESVTETDKALQEQTHETETKSPLDEMDQSGKLLTDVQKVEKEEIQYEKPEQTIEQQTTVHIEAQPVIEVSTHTESAEMLPASLEQVAALSEEPHSENVDGELLSSEQHHFTESVQSSEHQQDEIDINRFEAGSVAGVVQQVTEKDIETTEKNIPDSVEGDNRQDEQEQPRGDEHSSTVVPESVDSPATAFEEKINETHVPSEQTCPTSELYSEEVSLNQQAPAQEILESSSVQKDSEIDLETTPTQPVNDHTAEAEKSTPEHDQSHKDEQSPTVDSETVECGEMFDDNQMGLEQTYPTSESADSVKHETHSGEELEAFPPKSDETVPEVMKTSTVALVENAHEDDVSREQTQLSLQHENVETNILKPDEEGNADEGITEHEKATTESSDVNQMHCETIENLSTEVAVNTGVNNTVETEAISCDTVETMISEASPEKQQLVEESESALTQSCEPQNPESCTKEDEQNDSAGGPTLEEISKAFPIEDHAASEHAEPQPSESGIVGELTEITNTPTATVESTPAELTESSPNNNDGFPLPTEDIHQTAVEPIESESHGDISVDINQLGFKTDEAIERASLDEAVDKFPDLPTPPITDNAPESTVPVNYDGHIGFTQENQNHATQPMPGADEITELHSKVAKEDASPNAQLNGFDETAHIE